MSITLADLPCAVLISSREGSICELNDELEQLLALPGHDLVGQPIDMLFTVGSRIFIQTHVLPMLWRNQVVREVYLNLRAADGEQVPVYLNARQSRFDGQAQAIWVFHSAQGRRQFEAELIEARRQALKAAEQLQVLVVTDPLTQVGNRMSLEKASSRLKNAATLGRGFAVLMLDIDHFKQVNDQYGHVRGDAVLKAVAQCLKTVARDDDIVVRYGGEEFCLILPSAAIETACQVAERVHAAVQQARPTGLPLTMSIGVAASANGKDDLYDIIGRADAALYEAKQSGRNCTVVSAGPPGA
jgi:diguanylate cyclase (GGDEF)-like protein